MITPFNYRPVPVVAVLAIAIVATCSPSVKAIELLVANNRTISRFDGATGQFIDEFIGIDAVSSPKGMDTGPDGNLYVADFNTGSVLRFDGTTGAFIDVFASGSGLIYPFDLAFGPDDNLYVTTGGAASGVMRFDGQTGGFIDRFFRINFSGATGLAFASDGDIFTSYSDRIVRFDVDTGLALGSFLTARVENPPLSPVGLEIGLDGQLLVADFRANVVRRLDPDSGLVLDTFASVGLDFPLAMTFGPDRNLYVTNFSSDEIVRLDGQTGDFIDVFASGSGASLPYALHFIPEPNAAMLMVAAAFLATIRRRLS